MFSKEATGGITDEAWNQLQKLYTELDKFVKLVGLEYTEDGEYVCTNSDQVDDDWCDYEMLASLENAHADLGYFLGKR